MEELYITESNIRELRNLSHTLRILHCPDIDLTELPLRLPPHLEELYCSRNALDRLPNLPHTLRVLNCSENFLSDLPSLPPMIEYLNCKGNTIRHINLDNIVGKLELLIDIDYLDNISIHNIWSKRNQIKNYDKLKTKQTKKIFDAFDSEEYNIFLQSYKKSKQHLPPTELVETKIIREYLTGYGRKKTKRKIIRHNKTNKRKIKKTKKY
jgi:Leucine-rich repeat (LRR) protein